MARHESGQAAVETAIVMPMTVFIILALFQIGLLHQGRSMLKYAAYKAVRAGSIHNAKMEVMQKAAVAVLLPVIGHDVSGGEGYTRTANASGMGKMWDQVNNGASQPMHPNTSLPVVNVRICNPTQETISGSSSVDFDETDQSPNASEWKQLDKGKLIVQLTFYYRLVIPFANMVLWNITRADEVGQNLIQVTRLGPNGKQVQGMAQKHPFDNAVDTYGPQHKYFLPIRTAFSMRMQSNFLLARGSGFDLPATNECVINFNKK